MVKTLEVAEAADLGYDMVLSNTFHLFLAPGPELIERFGGVHGFMRWDKPVITDSGGFQVFSMGHGTVADEIKGRAAAAASAPGAILGIDEQGVRFRSYVDGAEKFMGPETSMAVQAALGSDIALVFDECLPFHVTREYTRALAPSARTAGSTAASPGTREHGPDWQGVYGIVQGGVDEELRRWSAREVAARDTFGLAIGGTLGQDKPQMYEVVGWTTEELPEERPRHLLGIGDVDDLLRGVELGIDTFDCAMPTRIGRHGMAIVPDPERRWRVDLAKGRYRESDEPLCQGCPCAACARRLHAAPTCTTSSACARRPARGSSRCTTSPTCSSSWPPCATRSTPGWLAEAVAAARAGAAPWAAAASACCRSIRPWTWSTVCCDVAARRVAQLDRRALRRRRRAARRRRPRSPRSAGSAISPRSAAERQLRRRRRAAGARASRARRARRGRRRAARAARRLGDRLQPRAGAAAACARAASSRTCARASASPRCRSPGAAASPPSAPARRRAAPSASACSIAAASAKRSAGSRSSARATTSESAGGMLGVDLVQRRRRARVLLAREVGQRGRLVGQPPREQLVGDDAERVEVGGGPGRLAARLLGREVGGGAEHRADLASCRTARPPWRCRSRRA